MAAAAEAPSADRSRRLPIVTMIATGIALAAAACQYAIAGMAPALERAPGGLPHGQWWRLVTPVLVQTDGLYQVVINLVTLALLGAVTELLLGRRWWAALLCAGTLGGQIAAYAWQVPGGGASIAICGFAGGIVIMVLASRDQAPRFAAGAAVYYIAALTGWSFDDVGAAELACLVAAMLWHGPRLIRPTGSNAAERIVLAAMIPCAIVLLVRQDLHGAALTASMLLTGALRAGLALRHRTPAIPEPVLAKSDR